MTALKIAQFGGQTPRTAATELAPNGAQQALNAKLYQLELQPINGSLVEYVPLMNNIEAIYRLYPPDSIAADTIWLSWQTDVDVVMGPVSDETDARYYYTGAGTPKKSNWLMSIGSSGFSGPFPYSAYEMGVPAPISAPSVSVQGTANANDSLEERAYIYTYLSTFGSLVEESAPSPASNIVATDAVYQTVLVSSFSAPPAGAYNITGIRIYRTITGASGAAEYVQVAEIDTADIPGASFNDNIQDAAVGEACPSIGWNTPPDNIQGLVAHPSGFLAAFADNTVYFSVPFYPHAWPESYALSFPTDVVALAVWGTSIVVATKAAPYMINGVAPGALSQQLVPLPEPCLSKRSMVVTEYGAFYASPNGVIEIGYVLQDVMSTGIFRRDDWQPYNPASMNAVVFDQKYYAFFSSSTFGSKLMAISKGDVPSLEFYDIQSVAPFVDLRTSEFFYVDQNTGFICQFDSDTNNPLTYTWQSKRFVYPKAISFSIIKVDADYSGIAAAEASQAAYAAGVASNQAIEQPYGGAINGAALNVYCCDGSKLRTLPPVLATKSLTVALNGDGGVQYAEWDFNTFDPQRVPAVKNREYSVELTGNIPVRSVSIATTWQELYV
jgi:hypothetical protein